MRLNDYNKSNFWVIFGLAPLIAIALIPYVSLPIFPTDYRPVSVLFLIVPGVMFVFAKLARARIETDEVILFALVLVTTVQAVFAVSNRPESQWFVFKAIASIGFGVCSYYAFKACLARDTRIRIALRILALSYGLVIVVGVFEALAILGLLPFSIKVWIASTFSGYLNTRLQLVTQEASWAAMLLLFGIPLLWYQYKITRGILWFFLMVTGVLLFFFSFSLASFGMLVVAVALYLVFSIRSISLVSATKVVPPTIAILALAAITTLYYKQTQPDVYYTARLENLTSISSLDSTNLVSIADGSAFIRIYYPLEAFVMFVRNPMGVGPGQYGYELSDVLREKYPAAIKLFDEVRGDVETDSGDPKNLVAKIAAEHGLTSGIFAILFVLYSLQGLFSKSRDNDMRLRRALVSVALGTTIQFGSWAYLPFWFAFALNNSLRHEQRCADAK